MREVSQNWLNNQNKTLRDQGLLRLDFLSAHNNNAYAHIIPMGSDASKSNINEIKEIYPYGSPNKNLAMPNLMGKPKISAGVYRVRDLTNYTLDYEISTGIWTYNSKQLHALNDYIFTMDDLFPNIMQTNQNYYFKFYPISEYQGFNYQYRNTGTPNIAITNEGLINTQIAGSGGGFRLIEISGATNPQNITFKLQLEQGTTATDYIVPQPNTGYVSTNPSGLNGEVATNLAMPDLTGKPDLGGGWFRLVDRPNANVIIDYNTNSGHYRLNSTGKAEFASLLAIFPQLEPSNEYTIRVNYISGYNSNPSTPLQIYLRYTDTTNFGLENVPFTKTFVLENKPYEWWYRTSSNDGTQIFTDYIFTIQLEKGSTASAYQLPDYIPIEVNVENYRSPLNGLTITWSENFGYAIDYSIEYNGEIYNYYGNTKKTVFVPIIVENTPDANFKIRVHKWSQGNVPIRIERVFVGLHIVNYQDRIFSYSKKRVNDVLSLELPQDEINFELSNIDRMFDPLWYNSYFKYLNEKTEIRVYSGFRLDGKNDEWIKNGTFYLTDWKAPNNSITASFTAKDILGLLDADEMYSKSGSLTLDEYCGIILGRDYKGVDDFEDYNLPINPDGSKKWNIRKNLAVPDLTGKPEISDGIYRIYDENGITIDYDYWTGEFTINGTASVLVNYNFTELLNVSVDTYAQAIYISGSFTTPYGTTDNISFFTDPYSAARAVTFKGSNKSIFIGSYTRGALQLRQGQVFTNYKFKLQLEYGTEETDYELPIENAIVPVSMETRTKREVLQLLAQSVNAHIHLDDDANISFIRDVTGYNLNADKKVMVTKPEFNIAAPVKKIIVPISTYASDPNELELARIEVTAGEIIEINHDIPYSGGRVEVSGALTVASQDNTWFRSYKIVVGGSGSGELVLFRHQMARTTINILQDVGSSGTTMTYENPMIDTKLKASRALTKIWSEISNSRQVEFDLRIDPLFDTLDVVSFPFKVLDLEQTEFMRIDELELNYNGAYKGKVKGVILSNYGGDLTAKTYIKHSKEFNSGEENLKWHLSNK